MTEIASLGIKIDSSDADKSAKQLDKMAEAAKRAAEAVKKMEAQMAGFSSTTKNVVTEEAKRQKSIDNLIKSLTFQEIRLKEGKTGLDNYKASILGATEAEKKQISALNASIKAMQDANAAAKSHDNVLGSLITRLSALGAAYFGLQAIKEFTKDVVLLSARYETLGVVVENVGKTAGYSMLEINEQSKALQKQGISMIQSRESITKLIQAHIDLSNAQKLGRIAQDAAVIGNVNSSHALERIVYGIQTAQIEVLKSVGLNVNFENSYKKLSIQLGKSTTDLTESEKTQARLNVVLERGADIAGTYESAMTTAGKQITSFTRYLEDFKVIFGQAFNDATAKIVSDLTIYMKEFTGTIGSSETQSGLKQFADGLGVILTTFISLGKAAIAVTKYIGELGNISKNLSIEQKGIDLVNKGLIDQIKYTKATWEEKKKLIEQAEPITKITKKIGEQTEGYNLYSEAVKKSSEEIRKTKKAEQDALDKSLLDQKKAQKESETAMKKAESDEKARQGRVDAIINKMKEQIATYKQATEVSVEYQLAQEGASPAEIKLAKSLGVTLDALKAKTKAQEAYNKVMDKTAADPVEMNRAKAIEAVNEAVTMGAVLNGTYAESIAQINKHFDNMDMEKSDKALKEMGNELDKLTKFDGSSFGNTIADGINNAMISMDKLNDTFDNNVKAQELIKKLQKEINTGKGSPEERKEKLEQIDKAESKMIENQISGYRQLFGTTSQLFKENSKEREAMHNLEMVFAAAEIAINLEKTISAAYTAIMVQGAGDPYSAFARIAAMTALAGGIVAAAGGSLSGGGSGSTPAVSSQASQSTGSVFGMSSEISLSASNALEFLNDIESKQYNELKNINSGVIDLNKNITGLVTNIIRTGAGSSDMGIQTGVSGGTSTAQDMATRLALTGGAGVALMGVDAINKISGNNQIINAMINTLALGTDILSGFVNDVISDVSNAVFGGSKKTTILAQGLEVSTAKIGDLLEGAGLDIQKFADIKIKKSGGLFGSDKTYLKTITQALEPEEEDIKIMFTNVFKNMGETMVAISSSLNLGEDNLKQVLEYSFDIGKLDLKGMDSDAINEAVSAAISKAGDEAVTALFGSLIEKYVQVGEGLLETAIRVVSERAVVLDILEMTNQDNLEPFTALSIEVTQSLVSIAGGIKELQDAASTYYDKFFTDTEKQTRLQGQLSEAMVSMGETLPKTRDGLRAIIEGLDLTTEAGQKNYVALLELSENFDTVYSNIEAEQEKKLELELQIMNLTGKSAEALAIQRQKEIDALSEANKPLQERIYALQDEALIIEENQKIEEERTAKIKAAKDEQNALSDKQFDLEMQILKLTGKEVEATALLRQKELDAMDQTLQPLQEMVWKLEDLKDVASGDYSAVLEEQKKAVQKIIKDGVDNFNYLMKSSETFGSLIIDLNDKSIDLTERLDQFGHALYSTLDALTSYKEAILNSIDAIMPAKIFESIFEQTSTTDVFATVNTFVENVAGRISAFGELIDIAAVGVEGYLSSAYDINTAYMEAQKALNESVDLSEAEQAKVAQAFQGTVDALAQLSNDIMDVRAAFLEKEAMKNALTESLDIFQETIIKKAGESIVPVIELNVSKDLFEGLVSSGAIDKVAASIAGVTEGSASEFQSAYSQLIKLLTEGTITTDEFNSVFNVTKDIFTGAIEPVKTISEDLEKRFSLEMEILRLTGKETEAVKLEREKELATLGDSLKPLQERVWFLQDEADKLALVAAISEEKANLELKLAELTLSDSEYLVLSRKKELDAINDSNKAIQEKIWVLEDEKAAQEAAAAKTKEIAEEKANLELQMAKLTLSEIEYLALTREKELLTINDSNKNIQERVWALEDEKTALEKATALLETKNNLMIELYNLEGKASQATALSRSMEISKLDESLHWIQLRIWALEDEKAATEKANDVITSQASLIETSIKSIMDTLVEKLQLAADAANKSLDNATSLLERSFDAEEKRLTTEHKNIIDALNTSLSEAEESVSSLESAFSSLKSTRESMVLAGTENEIYKTIQDQLFKTLVQSRAGDFSGLESLTPKLSTLSGDNRALFSSETDYKRDFLKTYIAMSELETLTGTQLTEQQQIVKNLETQIEQSETEFNLTIEALNNQLDGILKVDKSITSIEKAIEIFKAAREASDIANLKLAEAEAEREKINNIFEAEHTTQFNQMIITLGSINGNTANFISSMEKFVASMGSVSDVAKNSSSIPGFADGGIHYGGLRIVGENGPEMEYTPPSNITSNNDLKSIMSNEEVVEELRSMRKELAIANFQIAKNTQDSAKTLKKFDYDGMPEVRTA